MAENLDSVVSIRVPYKNLKQAAEVEMVGFDDDSPANSRVSNGVGDDDLPAIHRNSNDLRSEKKSSLMMLILSCTVAAGVQFGWALQLSLLTPYVQVFSLSEFCC